MFVLVLLFVISIFVYFLNKKYFLLAGCRRIKTVNGENIEKYVTVIKGSTIFGNNFDQLNKTLEKLFVVLRTFAAQRKNYLLYVVRQPILNIVHHEYAELILTNHRLLHKSYVYHLLEPFLGTGLITSADKKWHLRRKLLTPAFHFSILQNFLDTFKEETVKFINELKKCNDNNQILTLTDAIPFFTLNNICGTAVGINLNDINKSIDYRHNIHQSEEYLARRLCNPAMYPDFIYNRTADHHQYASLMDKIHSFTSDIINIRRIQYQSVKHNTKNTDNTENKEFVYMKKERHALLDTLLKAETENLIDHRGICEEVDSFIFAGYDTASATLIFTLLILSLHEEIQEKCFNEILQTSDDVSTLTQQDCNNLKYLECVIKETLRLYPPVPLIGRTLIEDAVIGNLIIPKGADVNIHIFDIHRDPKNFPNPEVFDPDRFLPENSAGRHPFAYIPFSAGQRNCIGQKFAMLEIKVLLANVIKNYKLFPVTQLKDIVFEAGLVLRPKDPVEIKIKSRK